MKKELVCISCPIGCRLTVTWDGERVSENDPESVSVEGNRCGRGVIYGREEALAPKRVVTATVPLAQEKESTGPRRLPVKTDAPIPRERISELLSELYAMEVTPPVKTGQVLIDNIDNTGINVVATKSVGV